MSDEHKKAGGLIIGEVDAEYTKYLESLSQKKQNRIRSSLANYRHGMHAIAPLTCKGPDKCPFLAFCPIPEKRIDGTLALGKTEDYPVHRSCVLERLYMEQKIVDYQQHLDVDIENPVEVSIVNDLAMIDLYKNRAAMIMSLGDRKGEGRDFLKINTVGFSENGDEQTTTGLHPIADYIDRLEKRREKLLSGLLETRKGKANMAAKLGSPVESRVLDELREIRRAMEDHSLKESGKLIEAEPLLLDD